MKLRISLTASAPIALRAGREQSHTATLDYIPGPAILGSLAWAHQQLGRDKDEFARWFAGGAIHFSNLYPAGFDHSSLGSSDPVQPIPITARTCKRFDGFHYRSAEDGDERHGVQDGLVQLALYEISGRTSVAALASLRQCNQKRGSAPCGEMLDRMSGYYRRGSKPEMVGGASGNTVLRTHSGMSYRTGTVANQILYSRQVIKTGSPFWGEWRVADTEMEAFETFIEQAGAQGLLRIGTGRTRGLGRFQVGTLVGSMDTTEEIKKCVERFTSLLKSSAGKLGLKAPAAAYVPLTLTSDCLLVDNLLRPRLKITGEDLGRREISNAQVVYCAIAVRRIEGWNDLWGLPKTDQLAIEMGSVFLLALETLDAVAVDCLLRVQEEGIGLRHAEGYGRLRVADPFHTDFQGVMR
jgi:CRISPR-associated Csx10 family RAMP protein